MKHNTVSRTYVLSAIYENTNLQLCKWVDSNKKKIVNRTHSASHFVCLHLTKFALSKFFPLYTAILNIDVMW